MCPFIIYTATLTGSSSMPAWASLNTSSRAITGILPSGITSAEFTVTAKSTLGQELTLSVPVSSHECEIKHCIICPTASQCSKCEESFRIHRENHCILDDPIIGAASTTVAVAFVAHVVFATISSMFRPMTTGSAWNLFNMI